MGLLCHPPSLASFVIIKADIWLHVVSTQGGAITYTGADRIVSNYTCVLAFLSMVSRQQADFPI